MATTIITKNGSGAPLAGDLTAGELAVDLTNKRLYSKDSGGTVIELGTTPSGISGGTIDDTVIGGTTPAAGTFTSLTATGDLTVDTDTLVVDSTNNRVGIGEASPSYELDIGGASTQRIRLNRNSGTDVRLEAYALATGAVLGTYSASPLALYTDSSPRLTILSGGNVGIGESSPDSKLVVRGVHGSDSRIHISSGSAGQTSFDGSGSGLLLTAQNMNVTSKFTPAIMFGTKDTDFTTTNPKVGAAINAIASQTYSTDSTGGMDLAFYTTPNDPGTGQTTTERMRIDSSGNVGIGETTPSAKLQVNGGAADYTSSATGTGLFHVSGGATSEYTFYVGVADQGVQLGHNGGGSRFLSFETNETERMRIDSSGSLLVGRTSGVGSERLAVQGAALVGTFYSANSTANGTLMSYYSDVGGTQQQVAAMQRDGDIFNANNTYGALSDERLKSNIVDASSQLDDIMAVQVRSYTLNATGNTHIGVVAQELEASGMSGLVSEDENGMKSVKYSVLYMKAIKAIQEQQAMIETLQAQVAELQGAN